MAQALIRNVALVMICALACYGQTSLADIDDESVLKVVPLDIDLVDENGINILYGTPHFSTHALSIGQPGQAGLGYRATQSAAYDGWMDHDHYGAIESREEEELFEEDFLVRIGPHMERFNLLSNGTFEEREPLGSTLTFNSASQEYTLVQADGTVATFAKAFAWGGKADEGQLVSIVRPSGERRAYSYRCVPYEPGGECIYRLQSVTNNFGYQLRIEYSTTYSSTYANQNPRRFGPPIVSVTLFNMAIDYCAPSAPTCDSFTRPWPRLDFEWLGASSPWSLRVTNSNDETTTYVYETFTTTTDFPTPGATLVQGPYLTRVQQTGLADTILTYNLGAYPAGQARSKVASVKKGSSTWTYSIDGNQFARTTTITNPLQHSRVYQIDGSVLDTWREDGNSNSAYYFVLDSETDELGHVTSYEWTNKINQRPTRITYPEGNSIAYTYDSRGNVTQTTRSAKPASGLPGIVVSLDYDATCSNSVTCNQPNFRIDARGARTDYTYDASHGGVLTITGPAPFAGAARPQIRHSYAALYAWYKGGTGGVVQAPTPIMMLVGYSKCRTMSTCAGTADEVRTSFAYGTSGTANNLLPTSVTLSSGDSALTRTVTTSFDDVGNPVTTDGPLPGAADTVAKRYDAMRQLVGIIEPDPDGSGPLPRLATRLTYNGNGQVTKIEKGTATAADLATMSVVKYIEATYDSVGHKVKEQVKAGSTTHAVTQYSYDATSRLQCIAVRMNPAALASPPSSACALGSAGNYGLDRVTRNVYNEAGQVIKIQRAYGTPVQQDYASYAYSNNGKRTSVIDAKGNKANFVYDGFDRLTRWNFPSKTTPGQVNTADYEAYTYDANDNLTSLRKRNGQVIGYFYDNLNRVTLKDVPGTTNDVYYDYDLRGLQLFARFGSTSGEGITTIYDALGQVVSSTTTMGGASRTLSYQYDPSGNRTRITHPDGTYFTYTYDALGRNTEILQSDSASLLTLVYDAPGRRAELQRLNGAYTSYDYDGISRLDGIIHGLSGTADDVAYGFAYNPASQIVSRTISNGGYEYANHSVGSENYSVNGLNQYSAVDGEIYTYDMNGNLTSNGVTTYTYDIENRLVSAAVGSTSTTLKYDPLGRLYEVSGGGSGATTRFLYDGNALVAEYNSGGAVTNRYVHGPGVDEPMVWYDGSDVTSGSRRFLYTDHIGSITGITDNAGTVLVVNRYDPYGVADPQNFGRFAFTGQIQIPELGLYYYKARIYSPALGRFLQTDPVGYEDDLNLYAYVHNDPANRVDPLGQEAACISLGTSCGINSNGAGGRFMAAVSVATDFTPVIGDIKGIVEAVQDPSVVNIAAAIVGLGGPIGDAAGKLLKGAENVGDIVAAPARTDFIVDSSGTAFPVPKDAVGPTPVINRAGSQTGVAYTGGQGGANGQVSTLRNMDPTPSRGSSPGYPDGYVRYDNAGKQGVDPYTGRTLPNTESHFPKSCPTRCPKE